MYINIHEGSISLLSTFWSNIYTFPQACILLTTYPTPTPEEERGQIKGKIKL